MYNLQRGDPRIVSSQAQKSNHIASCLTLTPKLSLKSFSLSSRLHRRIHFLTVVNQLKLRHCWQKRSQVGISTKTPGSSQRIHVRWCNVAHGSGCIQQVGCVVVAFSACARWVNTIFGGIFALQREIDFGKFKVRWTSITGFSSCLLNHFNLQQRLNYFSSNRA